MPDIGSIGHSTSTPFRKPSLLNDCRSTDRTVWAIPEGTNAPNNHDPASTSINRSSLFPYPILLFSILPPTIPNTILCPILYDREATPAIAPIPSLSHSSDSSYRIRFVAYTLVWLAQNRPHRSSRCVLGFQNDPCMH